MRDSYLRFFSQGYITKDQFFEFGLKETIYSPYEKAQKEWSDLKENILNNQPVFIRGFGRDANGTHLFQEFYKVFLGNENIKKDPTNNDEPSKLLRNLTGYSKSESNGFKQLRNYQVSHIFGRTKNVYAFTAPWNIVYMPKILDPLTGHEAKGEMVDEFTHLFQKQAYKKFGRLIDDFNDIISNASFKERLINSLNEISSDSSFESKDVDKLLKAVNKEFEPIDIDF